MILSLAGGAIGILFAWWTGSALLGLLADSANLPLTANPDLRVLGFTLALSTLSGIVFGLAPAFQATSPKLALTLKDQAGHVSPGGAHVRLRKALVVSQVALSLMMLIAAALFSRSLHNLKSVELGFRQRTACSVSRCRPLSRQLSARSASGASPRTFASALRPSRGFNPPPSALSH